MIFATFPHSLRRISTVNSTTHNFKPAVPLDRRNTNVLSTHQLWYGRGRLLAKQGHYQAALTCFNEALRLQQNDLNVWVFRGVMQAHLGLYEAALNSFDRAVAISFCDRSAWIFRGTVLTALNRHADALKSYSVALTLQRQGFSVCEDYPLWTGP